MTMISVPITIPQDMAPYVAEGDQKADFERNAMMLYPLIQNMTISHGRAAEILGVYKLDLIEFYNSMGIPYLRQSKEELDEEIGAYRTFKEKKA